MDTLIINEVLKMELGYEDYVHLPLSPDWESLIFSGDVQRRRPKLDLGNVPRQVY